MMCLKRRSTSRQQSWSFSLCDVIMQNSYSIMREISYVRVTRLLYGRKMGLGKMIKIKYFMSVWVSKKCYFCSLTMDYF